MALPRSGTVSRSFAQQPNSGLLEIQKTVKEIFKRHRRETASPGAGFPERADIARSGVEARKPWVVVLKKDEVPEAAAQISPKSRALIPS